MYLELKHIHKPDPILFDAKEHDGKYYLYVSEALCCYDKDFNLIYNQELTLADVTFPYRPMEILNDRICYVWVESYRSEFRESYLRWHDTETGSMIGELPLSWDRSFDNQGGLLPLNDQLYFMDETKNGSGLFRFFGKIWR